MADATTPAPRQCTTGRLRHGTITIRHRIIMVDITTPD